MGYTNYYYRPLELEPKSFKLFSNEVKEIVKFAKQKGIKIAGADGTGKETINIKTVSLNGLNELSHETFSISQKFNPSSWDKPKEDGLWFDFCKTARKPYDLVVSASLLSFKYHFPNVRIASDGGFDETEWVDGYKLYQEATGRFDPSPEEMLSQD